MHNHHDNFRRFPASVYYRDGKTLVEREIALESIVPGRGGAGREDKGTVQFSC